MAWSRRDFLRASATVGAASAFDLENLGPVEAPAQAVVVDRWQKAPCRFCGTGCGVLVEYPDTFFFRGANMAEMHPVLFSRILDRRQKHPQVRLVDLSTVTTRTSEASDIQIVFKPQTDLAIANGTAHVHVSLDDGLQPA